MGTRLIQSVDASINSDADADANTDGLLGHTPLQA